MLLGNSTKWQELTKLVIIAASVLAFAAAAGCEKKREIEIETSYDFVEHLNEAEIISSKNKYVQSKSFKIGLETRRVIYEHPESEIKFKQISIKGRPQLKFAIAINEKAWKNNGDGVLFEIWFSEDGASKEVIYSRYIDPKNSPKDRKWIEESIDLRKYTGKVGTFTFKTSAGPRGNLYYDWAGWAEPKIEQVDKISIRHVKPKHLNVILITADTLRADYLGCYGNSEIRTPNIDKMAEEGVLFENCFSQCSTTNPSHASILSSLYVKNHSVYDNKTKLDENIVTIAEILKGRKFRTIAAVSAFHLNASYSGFGQGFEDYYNVESTKDVDPDKFLFLTRRAKATNEKVLKWLTENYEQNFFMWIHYFDPHSPYAPPKPYNKMYYSGDPTDSKYKSMERVVYPDSWDGTPKWLKGIKDLDYPKAQYMGEITYLDYNIGKLMGYLQKFGIDENTLIVLTSDHGEGFGEHDFYFNHWGLHKKMVHIPAIFWCPEMLRGGKRIEALTMSLDIVPTVLDLLKLGDAKMHFDGVSLAGVMNGESELRPRNIFSENMGGVSSSLRKGDWTLIKDLKTFRYSAKYRFVKDRTELYNTDIDPNETRDIAGEHLNILKQMHGKLSEWIGTKDSECCEGSKSEINEETKERLRALGYAH